MTDNEIIKALESEIHLAEYVDSNYCSNIDLSLIKSTLDLINRLQAENENSVEKKFPYCVLCGNGAILTENLEEYDKLINNISTGAIKEFAERLKRELTTGKALMRISVLNIIDSLVKEMVGEE